MNNEQALNAFLVRKTEIDNALARLQALSDNHFNTDPNTVNWADVGELGRYAELLKQITDAAFSEGENA